MPQTFAWSDGSPVAFTDWGFNMPNKHADAVENCNTIHAYDYKW